MSTLCIACGTELPEGAAFCLKCGAPVGASAPVRKPEITAAQIGAAGHEYMRRAVAELRSLAKPHFPLVWTSPFVWPASAVVGLLMLTIFGHEFDLTNVILGLLTAVIPCLLYLAIALLLDRYQSEPPAMLAKAFVWGATGATMIAFFINTYATQTFGDDFGSNVSAPFVEEFVKAIPLFVIFWWNRDYYNDLSDGVVLAIMVGLGFATMENVSYYAKAWADGGFANVTQYFITRGILGPFGHPLFTSMTGIGLALAARARDSAARAVLPFGGYFAAILMHSIWNQTIDSPAKSFVYFLFMVPVFFGVLRLVRASQQQRLEILRANLAQEVEMGSITPQELATLTDTRARALAMRAAWKSGGHELWWVTYQYYHTATELAMVRWRAAEDPQEAAGLTDREKVFRQYLLDLKARLPSQKAAA